MLQLRAALLIADWASAASWGSLSTLLDSLAPDAAEQVEVEAARREMLEMRGALVTALERRLQRELGVRRAGRPVRRRDEPERWVCD